MNPNHSEGELWSFCGFPTFLTEQIAPGDMLAVTLIYAPTEERPDRYRIEAVKYAGRRTR